MIDVEIQILIHESYHKSEFRKVFERKFAWFGIDPYFKNSSIYKHECLCNYREVYLPDQLSEVISKLTAGEDDQTQNDTKKCTCGWSTKPTKNEYLAFQSFRNVVTFNRDYYTGHHEKEFRKKKNISIKQKKIDALKRKINQESDPSRVGPGVKEASNGHPSTSSDYVSSENNS